MSKQTEALKLALEALEHGLVNTTPVLNYDGRIISKAIAAIREALAEQPAPPPPECQTEAEKTAFAFGWWKALEQKRKADSALDRMAENARELGLDYEPIVERVENSVGMGHKAWDMVEPKELAKAFHEALAEQPAQQQEPVALDPKDVHVEVVTKQMGGFAPVMTNGIRLTHKPTGIVVEETAERSAHRNRDVAWKKLAKLVASPPVSKPWVGLDYEPDFVLPGGGHVPAVPVAVYGYCPECGGAGVMRERRPNGDDKCTNGHKYPSAKALAEQPAQRTWVGLTHEDTYEATGTASTDLLDLAKLWSDNKVHVYQFDNEARKIIEAVLRRASAKLREKNA